MAKLVDVGFIASYFESLDDPRHTPDRRHLLVDIAVIAVCTIICERLRWTHRHPSPGQTPPILAGSAPHLAQRHPLTRLHSSHLIVLEPEAYQRCFQAWIRDTIAVDASRPDRLVAIDGKTCGGSRDQDKDLGALHIVSAWATEERIALGQVATNAISDEITAIPQLLEQIDLKGTLIRMAPGEE